MSVESHSGKEIAQLMSEVTGLEIKCEEKGVEEFKELVEAWISNGADKWYASKHRICYSNAGWKNVVYVDGSK